MQHRDLQQQLARATSMSVVVVLNVLCAGSQSAEAARALAPASPSYDAHRQRSCGIAGRTCDLCDRYRSQWPGGRPCIGNSRLTTGEGMDRSTTATVQAASGRKWSEQRAQPGTVRQPTVRLLWTGAVHHVLPGTRWDRSDSRESAGPVGARWGTASDSRAVKRGVLCVRSFVHLSLSGSEARPSHATARRDAAHVAVSAFTHSLQCCPLC